MDETLWHKLPNFAHKLNLIQSNESQKSNEIFLLLKLLYRMDETKIYKLGSVAGPVILANYTVNQRPHWACQQYGHSGEPGDG